MAVVCALANDYSASMRNPRTGKKQKNAMTMTAPHPIPLHPARAPAYLWRKPVLAAAVAAVLAGGAWFALQRAPAPATPVPATKVVEQPPVLELGSADVAAISARSLALSLPLSGSVSYTHLTLPTILLV